MLQGGEDQEERKWRRGIGWGEEKRRMGVNITSGVSEALCAVWCPDC